MLNFLLPALAGFSLLACLLLLFAYFAVYGYLQHDRQTRVSGVLLLISIMLLQLIHYKEALVPSDVFNWPFYLAAMMAGVIGFYHYSRGVLGISAPYKAICVAHIALVCAIPFVSWQLLMPLAFAMGTGHAMYFAWVVYSARQHQSRQPRELLMFGLFLLMAVVLTVLSLCLSFLPLLVVMTGYSLCSAIALATIILILLKYPNEITDTPERVKASYNNSTLGGVDKEVARKALHRLMVQDKLFVNGDLSLSDVAERMSLSTHQLSELVNTEFGYGFSQLLRKYRIEEAKRLLVDEPDATILALGLSVGFSSQSNFYTAFREVAGCTPGEYRKRQLA